MYCQCPINYLALTLNDSLLWLFDERFHDQTMLGCATCGKVFLRGEDVTQELEDTLQLVGLGVKA